MVAFFQIIFAIATIASANAKGLERSKGKHDAALSGTDKEVALAAKRQH